MIKYKTNAFIFLEFLQPILIIFIMAFTTSCQSDKTNSNNENTGKIVFVANTSQDNESPWLAFRDEPKYDGKLIYTMDKDYGVIVRTYVYVNKELSKEKSRSKS